MPPALESCFLLEVVEARRPEPLPETREAAALLFGFALLLAAVDPAALPVALLRVAGLVDDARPGRVVRPRAALEAAALEVKSNPVLKRVVASH